MKFNDGFLGPFGWVIIFSLPIIALFKTKKSSDGKWYFQDEEDDYTDCTGYSD